MSRGLPGAMATPVPPADAVALSAWIAAVLDELDLFTLAVSDDDDAVEADLEFEVALVGNDFGPGHASLGGGIFSSLAWLFAGHASWWIRDRTYPDSDVALVVSIRQPKHAGETLFGAREGALFEDVLQLNDLELSYYQRAGPTDSLLNVVVPPMLIEGDKQTTGNELVRAAIEQFARQEPEQLLTRLPGRYFAAKRSFIVYEGSSHSMLLAADEAVIQLTILSTRAGGAVRREVDPDAMSAYGVSGGDAFEEARLRFSSRASGVAARRYYRIPLGPDERGFVRCRALLNNGDTAGPWTVRVEGAAGQ